MNKINQFTVIREKEKITPSDSDAEFLGWQKTPKGELIALYNITSKKHPLYHSTVSERTLREQNLQVPQTPVLPKQIDIKP